MKRFLPWFMAMLSALLLELPFPLAGPLPPWRAVFAWFGLVPLLWALLYSGAASRAARHPLRRGFLLGYLAGILWYLGNCYWIYATMHIYGGLSPLVATFILVLYSLILGLYFGIFGFAITLLQRGFRSNALALLFAPALWVAVELAAAHITSVPWDQLGYSQVDNLLVSRLAPFTGVYGISFVLVALNALFCAGLLLSGRNRIRGVAVAGVLSLVLLVGMFVHSPAAPTQALGVLVQPNLDVTVDNDWVTPEQWQKGIAEYRSMSLTQCGPQMAGLPDTGIPIKRPDNCQPEPISLIAWPESPSPFRDWDPRFIAAISQLAASTHATVIAGNIASRQGTQRNELLNAATVISPDGNRLGRYEKIHLVPFGEYVPYKDLIFFAGHLTQNVSDFSRGLRRPVFRSGGHRYGIFICYESIFGDEVRQFANLGAEAFVNISDDAWYGDTSAPWQHLNMARMRAIENNRWIVRDTNSGVTSVIDPLGRVIQSSARHQRNSLAVRYGFVEDRTFYTRYGDLFAILCAILSIAGAARAVKLLFLHRRSRTKSAKEK